MSFDHWTLQQAQRLAQIITLHHDQAAHSACLDVLEPYITAQLAGQDYIALFPIVTQHLDSCVACAEAYALVYEARLAEATDLLPIAVPAPALDFLRLSTADRLQRTLTAAIERLAERRLRFTLSQSLLDLLAPQRSEFALRGAAHEPMLDVTVDQPFGDDTRLQVSVYRQRDAQDQCTVRSQVVLADREWPDLADLPVTLTVGGTQRRAHTDPWGEAVFENVPIDDVPGLQIEVDVDSPPQTST
ncbi:MAG TPA: hypothetical protein VFZ66_06675 [Herpetosiphonaceae bacterium]